MNLRPMKYEDIMSVEALEKECFKTPWTYRMLSDSFMSDGFRGYVAEEDGRIIAYGGFTAVYEDASVTNIAVTADFRNKGVGTAVLEAIIDECKKLKVNKLFLEVRVSNAPAIHVYRKRGFVDIYIRERYYEDGEDAIVMAKNFVWS